MPEASTSEAETSVGPSAEQIPAPAAVNLAPAASPLPPSRSAGHVVPRAAPSRKRRLPGWRWLRVVALVIALPVAALGIGLLLAWIVHTIRGNPSVGSAPDQPLPSVSALSTTAPSPAVHRVVVPADWVVETDPPAGLTFRHPPGWIRRTALPEILRFAPVSPGSTTPGVEGVGAGIEPEVAPAQALQQFVTRAYGGEPQLARGPLVAVTSGHVGEQAETVSYVRSGVPVRVVVHAFASGGRSVIVLARAASADPARAGELEAAVEASLQITG
jgi:hypothetical protein